MLEQIIPLIFLIIMGSIPALIFMRKIKKAKDNSLKNKILIDWKKNSYKKLLIIPNISMFLIVFGNFSQFIKNERAFFISDQDIILIITNFIVLYVIGYVSLRLATNNFEKRMIK